MAYINTDRTGKFLLAASYAGAKLAIYPINAQGIVEAKAAQILDNKPKAHCVVIDAVNKNVYVPGAPFDLAAQMVEHVVEVGESRARSKPAVAETQSPEMEKGDESESS